MNDYILKVIRQNKGKPVNEIRRALIERAPADFKQGRNQRTWEERLNAACRELERWPKALVIALLSSLVMSSANAAESFTAAVEEVPPTVLELPEVELSPAIKWILPDGKAFTKQEIRMMSDEELAKHFDILKSKIPFRVKHPVIYRHARKVRTGCIFVTPIIKCGGAVAQIVTPFLL